MTTNNYRQFISLIPDTPLQVGEVLAHNADGTSTIELPDGAQFRARGQSVTVGSNAFVKGGEVLGSAPSLPGVAATV